MPTTSPFCGDRGRPVSLLSFPVFFRCKRYSDSVGAGADLIDGEQLCDLLKQYELGVSCTVRQIEDVTIDPEFFDEL